VADSPLVSASQSRWHAEGSIIAQAVTAEGLQATRHLSEYPLEPPQAATAITSTTSESLRADNMTAHGNSREAR
jgi:hypothetical protein